MSALEGDLLSGALTFAARAAREVTQREAILDEVLDTAWEAGASLRDLALVTGIPRSTLARRLARPVPVFAGRVEGEIGMELDTLRRMRLARAREREVEVQAEIDAGPAMAEEIAEANALTRLA